MRWLLFALIALHGVIHFMGFVKAFGLTELEELTQPIGRGAGVLWLVGGLAMLAAAVLLATTPRIWWMVGLGAVVLSQSLVVSAWTDAKLGTIANLLVLAAVVYGAVAQGPLGLRAEYHRQVLDRLTPADPAPPVTEADLAGLPEPVARYLRVAGAVGQPRPRHFRAAWRGRIRATAEDAWMEFTAEQHNFLDEPSRFFFMDARRTGLPVDAFHAFQEGEATMHVRLLSLLPMVDQRGPELTQAETVTLFNDLCLLAPGGLIAADIDWEPMDSLTVRGRYTVGSNSVSAVLSFNEAGELVDFVSDDRLRASSDGEQLTTMRWSTPVGDYRSFGSRRAPTRGEGRWHPPEGEYVYIELQLTALDVNGTG
jgi:hypothetical protein